MIVNLRSSIPMDHYDQDHCKRMELMRMLRMQNKCRILPLFGTLDLVTNTTEPVCRRRAMWAMMPMMRTVWSRIGTFRGILKALNTTIHS